MLPPTRPRQKAREILDQLGIRDPSLLRYLPEICVERGAYVREGSLEGAEARLTIRGDRGIITVRPRESYHARTRFSIAHELGHFELHRGNVETLNCDHRSLGLESGGSAPRRSSLPGDPRSAAREAEANEFASELLMPEAFFRERLAAQAPSLALVESLAERFQTSLFATTRRFTELSAEAVAAVFFRKLSVTQVWKSGAFEALHYTLPRRLRSPSYAFDAARGLRTPREMAAVEASSWLLKMPQWLSAETLREQARFFSALESGLSLLWIPEGPLLQRG